MATNQKRGPRPTVEWRGSIYCCRSHNTIIPDLLAMDRFDALVWLNQNTTPRGYRRANPLAGLAGALTVKAR